MKCPNCGYATQRVLESRPAREDEAIRRRRECESCRHRFTTYEVAEKPRLMVVKQTGLREEFDREKVLNGMVRACNKRPVSLDELREGVDSIERDLYGRFSSEVSTVQIGDRVMTELERLDAVAYVRFASVYLNFESPQAFAEIVAQMREAATAPVG